MIHWGSSINLMDADGTHIPVDFGTPLWRETMTWARKHGIDPMRVPAGSTVERDPQSFEIRYEEYVLDTDGGPLIVNGEPVIQERVERGEGPPMPFPKED